MHTLYITTSQSFLLDTAQHFNLSEMCVCVCVCVCVISVSAVLAGVTVISVVLTGVTLC